MNWLVGWHSKGLKIMNHGLLDHKHISCINVLHFEKYELNFYKYIDSVRLILKR